MITDQSIKFASRYENLAIAEKLINDVSEQYQLPEDYYGNILVAVTEAVNNAIQHGNKSNPDKNIEVVFRKQLNSRILQLKMKAKVLILIIFLILQIPLILKK
jgi:serine/threonine-protein kinase RsbW